MSEVVGRARLGRRTKELVKTLQPDDIPVLDHTDIDRVSAEELVDCGVRAVINVAPSSTGRFPNPGPLELVRGGVTLVDVEGEALFESLLDGDLIRLVDGQIWRNGTMLASGVVRSADALAASLVEQHQRVSGALQAFATNTLEHLQAEAEVLTEGIAFPPLRTRFRERHALVIARGPGYRSDLRMVRPYIRDFRPVLVAVDGGADALHEVGLRPDVIVGDFDSVSDEALRLGAELVVHGFPNGGAPGASRLETLGLAHHVVAAPGISEDLALELAHAKGAELIVAVGTHFDLVEFLERDRAGMASTFVTRLRVGGSLVDAKGVSRLVSRNMEVWPLVVFAFVGLVATAVAVLASPGLRNVIESVGRSIVNAVS